MNTHFDRKLNISTAGSRKSILWPSQTIWWSEIIERCRVAVRGSETFDEYLKLPKVQQDELKDVGGFVGGRLLNNRRKASNVLDRDIITLDLDNIPAGGTSDVIRRLEGLGCAYLTYSTRKHTENKPRLRVLFPISRTATADEYEPLARKMGSLIGIELCDPTTFEASRLMYFGSCCADSQYVFQFADKPFLDTDGLLATFEDWKDISEWPKTPDDSQNRKRMASKQGNPTEKPGIVGAFCRQYDIYSAIDTFLPGAYMASDTNNNRLTFAGGSTVGGAIVYDNGLFLYSHHATDPCSGRLVNAFDLVRLHKFGDLDDEVKPDTPVNKLPSFVNMTKLASQDQKVYRQQIDDDFGNRPRFQGKSTQWIYKLEKKPNGKGFLDTPKNIKLILQNDPDLAGKFAKDTFGYRDLLLNSVPWRKIKKPQPIDDDDINCLKNFLIDNYKIKNTSIIESSFSEHLLSRRFHPVREYLKSLTWDGVKRVDSLLIDYLGAEDSELTRAMTRITLTGAVARVFRPGCKFDYVLTLVGKQGLKKSSLLALLGGDWYTDSLGDVRGKDAYEQIQGSWIIELGELVALRKAEVEAVKRFVTTQIDKFRPAYARRSKEFPRQCIFIATTNDEEPLKDQTGNRRFWPVHVGKNPIDLSKRKDFPRDQIWAEAVELFKKGGPLMLPDNLEKQANVIQNAYTEESVYAGIIREKLDEPWGTDISCAKIRDKVCALEIWHEMLHYPKDKFTTSKAREINAILRNTQGWRVYPKNNGRIRHGSYGKQTVFERVTN